ncbi:major facilitator superfamily domain-containing protein, partial [Fennellomyces sp. T-0311]
MPQTTSGGHKKESHHGRNHLDRSYSDINQDIISDCDSETDALTRPLLDENWSSTQDKDIPDGGYGWIIVCVGFLLQFIAVGISESWLVKNALCELMVFNIMLFYRGVMQDYHEQHQFPNAAIQVSFVGTISNVLLNGMGPVARLLSATTSLRTVMLLSVILCVVGLEAASWSTKIWHFYLTRGILFGAGSSLAFFVALSIVPQWFNKRRGLALGISSTGTCAGAFSMPFIMTAMNSRFGGAWCYRMQGLITLVLGLISCALVKERKERSKERMQL